MDYNEASSSNAYTTPNLPRSNPAPSTTSTLGQSTAIEAPSLWHTEIPAIYGSGLASAQALSLPVLCLCDLSVKRTLEGNVVNQRRDRRIIHG